MNIRFFKPLTLLCACLLAFGCSDDDGGNGGNNNNPNNNNNGTTDDTIYQVQDENHPDFIPENSSVQLDGVVVTAVDEYGQYTGNVFVQEPDGGAFSGVVLFDPQVSGGSLSDLTIGYIVNVTGEIEEFALGSDTSGRAMTEIVNGSVELVAQGQPLAPELVASPQVIMTDPGGEEYEGVLVAVENVRRTGTNSYGDVLFTGGLIVGNDLMDAAGITTDGTCYSLIVGVLDYFFDYTVHPRIPEDIEVATDQNACAQVTAEICDDNIDNDGDGFTDCIDFDCGSDPACVETDCSDGVDNDGNGYTDCEDFSCQALGGCRENDTTLCADNIDNDGDGLTDCADWSCKMHPDVLAAGLCGEETGNAECSDGSDNDNDSYQDCADYSCTLNAAVTVCATDMEASAALCGDHIDNNGNGYTDCDDFGCQYNGFCQDVEETTDASCNNGDDDDGDGYADCDDWSCQRSILTTVCEGNVFTCSDGIDNDGNGFVDCNDFACRNCNFNHSSPVCEPCP